MHRLTNLHNPDGLRNTARYLYKKDADKYKDCF